MGHQIADSDLRLDSSATIAKESKLRTVDAVPRMDVGDVSAKDFYDR